MSERPSALPAAGAGAQITLIGMLRSNLLRGLASASSAQVRSAADAADGPPRGLPAAIRRHRYAVRGYASTAAKHGIAIFTAIHEALAGNPWIPPIPATA